MKQRGLQPVEAISRRHAMAAMVVAGAGLAAVARLTDHRPERSEIPPPLAVRPWVDVCHWTVRFPDPASEASAMADLPAVNDVHAILETLPRNESMHWTHAGVSTEAPPLEIVRVLRARIAGELSDGHVMVAGGWVLSRTEWNIMRLAASQGAMASNAP